jgi:hypothetical protein
MTITMAMIRNVFAALVAGVALIASGCSDATTREDVSDAREELREEQADLAEAKDEAADDIAEAKEHTVGKPVTEEEAAEARQEVAEARQDAAESISEEQQDVKEAAAELRTEEQRLKATQDRDAYVKEVEGELAKMEKSIEEMKEQASAAEGAAKDEINLKIDALQAQHDRTEEALDSLKSADLASWENHKEHVRTAMQDTGNIR